MCELRTASIRGIDVETRTDDHFLGAADDIQAIAIAAAEIPGVEPALGVYYLCRQIRRAIIAAHDIAPAYMQFANFSIGRQGAIAADDP